MSKSLFEIKNEYLQLLYEASEIEGELTFELDAALTVNAEELEAKLKAYFGFIRITEGEISVITEEKERLTALKLQKEKLIGKLKEKINEALTLFGEPGKSGNQKLKFDTLSLYNVYHRPLVITDKFNDSCYYRYSIKYDFTPNQMELLKAKFEETTGLNPISLSTISIDKKGLKEDILAGSEIPGAYIDHKKSYVVMK